jgi:hypothetical protein
MSTHRLSGRLPSHRKFARPVTVTVERGTDGFYRVRDGTRDKEHTTNYGYGPTKCEAIAEYKRMLVDDFIWMLKNEHNLSQPLTDELNEMRQMIIWR